MKLLSVLFSGLLLSCQISDQVPSNASTLSDNYARKASSWGAPIGYTRAACDYRGFCVLVDADGYQLYVRCHSGKGGCYPLD